MFCIEAIKLLNAAEVRRRAKAAKQRPGNVSSLVNRVQECIDDAAEAGKMSLDVNPLVGLRQIVTAEQAKEVWDSFRLRGFIVQAGPKRFRLSW